MPKNGKRPTVKQKKLIAGYGKKPEQWLVERDTPLEIVIEHREAGTRLSFTKGA